jgi:hypothetical protein
MHKNHQDDVHQRWASIGPGDWGIQDDAMDEDDKAEVKSRDHCAIKMKAIRALKFIRQAEAAVVKISIYIKDRTSWRKVSPKAVDCEVSLDGPTC